MRKCVVFGRHTSQASIRKAECRKRKQQQIDLFGSDDSDLSADSDDGSSSSNSS